MCEEKGKCENPEKLKGKPSECTPEQIRECHGDVAQHPCEEGEQSSGASDKEIDQPAPTR